MVQYNADFLVKRRLFLNKIFRGSIKNYFKFVSAHNIFCYVKKRLNFKDPFLNFFLKLKLKPSESIFICASLKFGKIIEKSDLLNIYQTVIQV